MNRTKQGSYRIHMYTKRFVKHSALERMGIGADGKGGVNDGGVNDNVG